MAIILAQACPCFFNKMSSDSRQEIMQDQECVLKAHLSLQERGRWVFIVFFSLSLILLWYGRNYACTSLIFTWQGLLPMQVRLPSDTTVCHGIIFMLEDSWTQVWVKLQKACPFSKDRGSVTQVHKPDSLVLQQISAARCKTLLVHTTSSL